MKLDELPALTPWARAIFDAYNFHRSSLIPFGRPWYSSSMTPSECVALFGVDLTCYALASTDPGQIRSA